MAIETFTWPTERGEAAEIQYRTREARFAGGYRQVVGDGPNNREDRYPVTLTGSAAELRTILAFFDRHAGAKAFLWTPPLGGTGLFTCADPRPTPIGAGLFKLSATFARAFHP
ncbi:phage tail protein [Pseudomonas cremoricolorata]|uniref:Phage minor tail n=1 Tax=Pseudomonas cremoricolorata TaxID=157783 RepID=A0A089WU76_9PSED|nr:phage tail protein [Pseudomonas cremoricolorata]AIR90759.1 phage minor tail [Pseudomonas cremoricolorata]